MERTRQRISVEVNGRVYEDEVEPRLLLVHYIRDVLGLTGTHIGCDTTNCGACTVLMEIKGEWRAIKSCTMFAVQADGRRIMTIEGVSKQGKMHPVQQAFWENHALQCGYCTPGMVMTSIALLNKNKNPNEEEVRKGLSGNLCRCTGYQNIIKAVLVAADEIRQTGEKVID